MAAEYHVRIKKEYAAAVIEDLEKFDAIELIGPKADHNEIPQWQKDEARRHIAAWKADPSSAMPWEEFLKELSALEDEV